jgi:hypothetical protein
VTFDHRRATADGQDLVRPVVAKTLPWTTEFPSVLLFGDEQRAAGGPMISNVCEIEGKKIMNGQLARDEWERLDKNLASSRVPGI